MLLAYIYYNIHTANNAKYILDITMIFLKFLMNVTATTLSLKHRG